MPIGANDYALEWYSLDETEDDFAMKDFSIARDERILMKHYFMNGVSRYTDGERVSAGRREHLGLEANSLVTVDAETDLVQPASHGVARARLAATRGRRAISGRAGLRDEPVASLGGRASLVQHDHVAALTAVARRAHLS